MTRHDTYTTDPALIFFSSAALLLLLVSMPATYAMVAPFHATGAAAGGIALALATLAAFEVGAVGCKLVTLAIPAWSRRMNVLTIILLALTTVANYANGYDLFAAAHLNPTLASIRTAGYGWLVATVYSATIPILLFVFLSATVARAKHLHGAQADAAMLTTTQAAYDMLRQEYDAAVSDARQWRRIATDMERQMSDTEATCRVTTRHLPDTPPPHGALPLPSMTKTERLDALARQRGVTRRTIERHIAAGKLTLEEN